MEVNPKTLVSEWKLVGKWAAWRCAHCSTGSRHGMKCPSLSSWCKCKLSTSQSASLGREVLSEELGLQELLKDREGRPCSGSAG